MSVKGIKGVEQRGVISVGVCLFSGAFTFPVGFRLFFLLDVLRRLASWGDGAWLFDCLFVIPCMVEALPPSEWYIDTLFQLPDDLNKGPSSFLIKSFRGRRKKKKETNNLFSCIFLARS